MEFKHRSSEKPESQQFGRSDRFIENQDGVYIKTREGLDGPHPDMATALNGLMKIAEQNQLSQYQTRMLYESVCEKALSLCNSDADSSQDNSKVSTMQSDAKQTGKRKPGI